MSSPPHPFVLLVVAGRKDGSTDRSLRRSERYFRSFSRSQRLTRQDRDERDVNMGQAIKVASPGAIQFSCEFRQKMPFSCVCVICDQLRPVGVYVYVSVPLCAYPAAKLLCATKARHRLTEAAARHCGTATTRRDRVN
jgi:hypothetical protein